MALQSKRISEREIEFSYAYEKPIYIRYTGVGMDAPELPHFRAYLFLIICLHYFYPF